MSDAFWGMLGSVITGLLVYAGVVYQSKKSNDTLLSSLAKQTEISDTKLEGKIEQYQAVTDTKIEELTREVRAHNDFAQRIPVMEAEERRLGKRLEILEARTH